MVSAPILNFPLESHAIVEKTLTLPPILRELLISLVNFVREAILNSPFTVASLRIISYNSSPSNLPEYLTLSTTADA